MSSIIVQIAAIISSLIFSGLIIFQILLAAGLPLGDLAWGGKFKVLPKKLRITSGAATIILAIAAMVFLIKGGIIDLSISSIIISILAWFFTIYLGLNILGNLSSKSKKEKFIMGPVSIIAFISCLVVSILG